MNQLKKLPNIKEDIFYPILDIIFPQFCILCKTKVYTEEECFPICQTCNKKQVFNKNHESAGRNSVLYFISSYDENVKQLIHAFKYNGIKVLGKYFSKRLFSIFEDIIEENGYDLIIPVPVHISKLYERTYNQAEAIAYNLGKLSGINYSKNILIKKVNTESQTQFKGKDRLLNNIGSFKIKNKKKLQNINKILLIDDIYTTGATARECVKTLTDVKKIQIDVMAVVNAKAG